MDSAPANAIEEIGLLYRRRNPEESTLYQVFQTHLETFLAQVASDPDARDLPKYVKRELRAYLSCGILSHGFARVYCKDCRRDLVVPLSCKTRGFCPSCGGRRMADTAAFLVDEVIPDVPMRQWVLTFPREVRYLIAYDPALCGDVLGIFVRTVLDWQQRKADEAGLPAGQGGSVTSIQRAGSAINLNVHFHSIFPDGYFAEEIGSGRLVFQPLPPPTDLDIADVACRVRHGIVRLLRRRGLIDEDNALLDEANALRLREPILADCAAASICGRIAFGPRAGQRVERYGGFTHDYIVDVLTPGCAQTAGFNLHAKTAVEAGDRESLEQLCRYICHPPLAQNGILIRPDGKLMLRLHRPYFDGIRQA